MGHIWTCYSDILSPMGCSGSVSSTYWYNSWWDVWNRGNTNQGGREWLNGYIAGDSNTLAMNRVANSISSLSTKSWSMGYLQFLAENWLYGYCCNRYVIWKKDGLQEEKLWSLSNLPPEMSFTCGPETGQAILLTQDKKWSLPGREYVAEGAYCLHELRESSCGSLCSETSTSSCWLSFRRSWRQENCLAMKEGGCLAVFVLSNTGNVSIVNLYWEKNSISKSAVYTI